MIDTNILKSQNCNILTSFQIFRFLSQKDIYQLELFMDSTKSSNANSGGEDFPSKFIVNLLFPDLKRSKPTLALIFFSDPNQVNNQFIIESKPARIGKKDIIGIPLFKMMDDMVIFFYYFSFYCNNN